MPNTIQALDIQIHNQTVSIIKKHDIVHDSKNIYTAKITFDEEWDGYAKTAVWKNDNSASVVTLLSSPDSIIPIPNSVCVKGMLYVGFYGNLEESVLTTPPSLPIRVLNSYGEPPTIEDVFTPSEYDNLMAEFATIYARCDDIVDKHTIINNIYTDIVSKHGSINLIYAELNARFDEFDDDYNDFNAKFAQFNRDFVDFESEATLAVESVDADKALVATYLAQITEMYTTVENLSTATAQNAADSAESAQNAMQNANLATEAANSAYDFTTEASIHAASAQSAANSAHDALDTIEVYAAQVARNKNEVKTYYDYIVEHDGDMMRYYIINFDGTAFKHNGETLTFDQIKEKCLDTVHFVYAQYNNRLYIPQYISNNNIFFDAAYIDSDTPQMHRIAISSSNYTSKYDFVLAKASDVPSDQHINDLIDAKLAQLAGNGVSY